MKVIRTDDGDKTTLMLDGSLTEDAVAEFRAIVDKVTSESRPKITLEMSKLQQIDNSGAAVIVSLFKRVRSYDGHVAVMGLRDQPRAIFRLLRLDRVFPI